MSAFSDLAMLSAASLVVSTSAMTGTILVQKVADTIEQPIPACTKKPSVLPSIIPDYEHGSSK